MIQKKDRKNTEYMNWIMKRRNICGRLEYWEKKEMMMMMMWCWWWWKLVSNIKKGWIMRLRWKINRKLANQPSYHGPIPGRYRKWFFPVLRPDRLWNPSPPTHTHTNTHTRTNTHAQTHTHKHTHTYKHTHTNTHTQTHTHKHKHTRTNTHTHKHTRTNTHTNTHTYKHTHTHTHAHTRTLQWTGGVSPRVEESGCKAEHSPSSSTEVDLYLDPSTCLYDVQRNNFTFANGKQETCKVCANVFSPTYPACH